MEQDKNLLFSELFSQNEKQLYSFIYSMHPFLNDVDDIMQETMTTLWDKFDEFDETKSFFKWACSFAYYKVREQRRRVAVHHKHFKNETIEILESIELPEQTNQEKKDKLEACIKALNHEEIDLLKKKFLGHGSIKEVAQTLKITPNSLYKKLQKIKYKLSLCVEKKVGLS